MLDLVPDPMFDISIPYQITMDVRVDLAYPVDGKVGIGSSIEPSTDDTSKERQCRDGNRLKGACRIHYVRYYRSRRAIDLKKNDRGLDGELINERPIRRSEPILNERTQTSVCKKSVETEVDGARERLRLNEQRNKSRWKRKEKRRLHHQIP